MGGGERRYVSAHLYCFYLPVWLLSQTCQETKILNIVSKWPVTISWDKRTSQPDSQKMVSHFWNSRNCFSVLVVYPSKESHAQHQSAQSAPRDSTLKLRTSLEAPLFSHFSPAQEVTLYFCWQTWDLINIDLRAVRPSWSYSFLSYLSPPAGHPELTQMLAATSLFGSPQAWPCASTHVCSSFELFQHAK